MVKQHLKSIKEGERVVETKMDLKASEAKILESLAEAAPQIIVQTSLIVILISDYIRQQKYVSLFKSIDLDFDLDYCP